MQRTRVARSVGLIIGFGLAMHGIAGAASLPAGWALSNVGAPALAGSAATVACSGESTAGCTGFSVMGAGTDIWGSADQFTFVYKELIGDGTVIARIESLQNTDTLSKAGLMVRASLNSAAAYGYVRVSAGAGVSFQRRAKTAASSTRTQGSLASAPVWLRLDRRGSTLTSYESSDGVTWSRIADNGTVDLPVVTYVGIAVTSHSPLLGARAVATNVTITQVPLTEWASTTVGSPAQEGFAASLGRGIAASSSGTDIGGFSDQFRFVYRAVSGDVDLIARVARIDPVDPWAKAGIMIRTSLTADASNAFMLVTPSQGLAFQRRDADGLSTVVTTAGTGTAPVWLKLERRGVVINAFRSQDGSTWQLAGSDTLDLPSSFYLGLAVTSHKSAVAASAVFDQMTVRATASSNQPPTVSLTSPAEGSVGASETVSIAASAADVDGTIRRVDFFVDGTLVASDTSAPYAVAWQSTIVGSHTIRAVAYDDDGAGGSAERVITVKDLSGNTPPLVAITSPLTGAVYSAAPASVSITAAASDPDGTVARVEFYVGSTLIGSDSTSPYSVLWSGVVTGSYTLTAVAHDAAGANASSAPVSVVVGSAITVARYVVFEPSTEHASVDYYVLEIRTTAATPVVVATQVLGKPAVVLGESKVDVTTTIAKLSAGRYQAVVSAVNVMGSTASSPVEFTR